MAHLFSNSDSHSKREQSDGRKVRSIPDVPWWVKAFGVVAIILVGLVVTLHLTGYGLGGHMSMPATDVGEHAAR